MIRDRQQLEKALLYFQWVYIHSFLWMYTALHICVKTSSAYLSSRAYKKKKIHAPYFLILLIFCTTFPPKVFRCILLPARAVEFISSSPFPLPFLSLSFLFIYIFSPLLYFCPPFHLLLYNSLWAAGKLSQSSKFYVLTWAQQDCLLSSPLKMSLKTLVLLPKSASIWKEQSRTVPIIDREQIIECH